VNGDRGLIVIVEDEPAIVELESLYLKRAGYSVHVETGGDGALAAIRRLRPSAVILDIALPGVDGIEICRAMRAVDDWTPVVFVTARDDEVDRVVGLELGADDYLTKPFSPRELVARVRGLLRRAEQAGPAVVRRVGDVMVDPLRRTVEAAGRPVELTATEFDLLEYLMRRPGQVFSRGQLLSAVWGVADYGASRTVDAHVAQVRTKLGAASPIRTVRGVGYSVEDRA
jgi:Response regulators consisting of a CheY-like receiver domain and a winged-helix DNA-binding domain